jgi:hypothetical protein
LRPPALVDRSFLPQRCRHPARPSDLQRLLSVLYDNNDDIEALCANDPRKAPGTYADIEVINTVLEKEPGFLILP